MDFKETSATSVEMQLNENKLTNADEIFKIFGFPTSIVKGGATQQDKDTFIEAVTSLLNAIEAALDKDFLLEKEKGSFYFAFDTKELTRGNIKERFEAYGVALDKHFMQTDEVRKLEDLEPIGFNFVKLGLGDVLYDPKTKQIYTPNTNEINFIGENSSDVELKNYAGCDNIESRANPNHDPKTGKFSHGSGEKNKKRSTKYAPSPRRNTSGITIGNKKYAKLCGALNTRYPGLKKGNTAVISDEKYKYRVTADGFGGMIINKKYKIK